MVTEHRLGLVAFFVYDFQLKHMSLESMEGSQLSALGVLLMTGYVLIDSFTSNLQEPWRSLDSTLTRPKKLA